MSQKNLNERMYELTNIQFVLKNNKIKQAVMYKHKKQNIQNK